MAEAHQGAATSTPDLDSSVEMRAVWRPCIPDNPYDHPLIVPSSLQPSSSSSPLPQSISPPPQQAWLNGNGTKGISSAACLDHDAGFDVDNESLKDKLEMHSLPQAATAMHEGISPEASQQCHAASPPLSLPDLQQQASGSMFHAQGRSQLQQSQQTRHSSAKFAAASVSSDCCSSRSTSASEGQDQQELLQPRPTSHSSRLAQQQLPAKSSPHEPDAAAAHGSSNSDPLPQEAYRPPEGACKVGPADSAASPSALALKAGQDATGEVEWLPGGLGSSFENGADDLRHSRSPPPPEASPSCPLNPPRKVSVHSTSDVHPV